MRNSSLSLFIILFALCSCKKTEQTPQTFKEAIRSSVQRWKVTSFVQHFSTPLEEAQAFKDYEFSFYVSGEKIYSWYLPEAATGTSGVGGIAFIGTDSVTFNPICTQPSAAHCTNMRSRLNQKWKIVSFSSDELTFRTILSTSNVLTEMKMTKVVK